MILDRWIGHVLQVVREGIAGSLMPNAMFTFIRLLYEFRIFHSQYTHWLESTSLSIFSDTGVNHFPSSPKMVYEKQNGKWWKSLIFGTSFLFSFIYATLWTLQVSATIANIVEMGKSSLSHSMNVNKPVEYASPSKMKWFWQCIKCVGNKQDQLCYYE